MPAFCFRVDGNHSDNGTFRKRYRQDYHLDLLCEFSPDTNRKSQVIVVF